MRFCVKNWFLAALGGALLSSAPAFAQQQYYAAPAAEATVPVSYVQDLERRLAALEASSAINRYDDGNGLEEADVQTKPNHKWRGRIYFDGITYDDSPNRDRENSLGFDTARIGVSGNVYELIKYQIEIEFEGTEVDFKDVYIQMSELPLIGHFKAGHIKEPIGLEELTSSRYDTFMEQSYATSSFTPSRNYGLMIYDHVDACEDITWFLGSFRHNSDDSPLGTGDLRQDAGDMSLVARAAWNPYYDELSHGRYLVHVGGAARYARTGGITGYRYVPQAWIGGQVPGMIAIAGSRGAWVYGAEAAVVWGALSLQSEYFYSEADSGEQSSGAYAQISYFLTGEHRGYKKSAKAFDRVKPLENFFCVRTCDGVCHGRGAIELAAAYSYADLNELSDGGYIDGYIFGVNWYLNPYSRVMFNYNHEDLDSNAPADAGASDIFGVRWQVDW